MPIMRALATLPPEHAFTLHWMKSFPSGHDVIAGARCACGIQVVLATPIDKVDGTYVVYPAAWNELVDKHEHQAAEQTS